MRPLRIVLIWLVLLNGQLYAQFIFDMRPKVMQEKWIQQRKIKSYTRLDSIFGENKADTTFFEFDKEGHQLSLKQTLANGPFLNESRYDDHGNLILSRIKGGSTNEVYVDRSFEYDQSGRWISMHDNKLGRHQTRTYDENGRVIRQTSYDKSYRTYEYDAKGRLVHTFFKETESGEKKELTNYSYTATGDSASVVWINPSAHPEDTVTKTWDYENGKLTKCLITIGKSRYTGHFNDLGDIETYTSYKENIIEYSVDRKYNNKGQLISNETFTMINEQLGVMFRFLYAYNSKDELIYEIAYRSVNGKWSIYYSYSYFNYRYF
jgi:YD repeat-containing protein